MKSTQLLKNGLRAWYTIARAQRWDKPQDAVGTFGSESVDILRNNRLCINIKGNHIRIILSINYQKNTAFIKWIGWHKDYNDLGKEIHTINSTIKKK